MREISGNVLEKQGGGHKAGEGCHHLRGRSNSGGADPRENENPMEDPAKSIYGSKYRKNRKDKQTGIQVLS